MTLGAEAPQSPRSIHTIQKSLSNPKNIAIVGLGNRAYKHAIPCITQLPGLFKIVVGCDRDQSAKTRFCHQFPDAACFSDAAEIVEWQKQSPEHKVDCAYVAVPHFAYEDIIKALIDADVHILREKPAALTEGEFHRCHEYAERKGIRLLTASQSRYSQRLARLKEWLPFIGTARFIEGTRTLNCLDLGEGWRAEKSLSGGGAISDVGWHLIDTLIGLATRPTALEVSYSELITTRQHQAYDVDDTAFVSLVIPNGTHQESSRTVSCNLRVSRVGQKKADDLIITGTDGTLAAHGEHITVEIFLTSGRKQLQFHGCHEESFRQLLYAFHEEICSSEPSEQYKAFKEQDLAVIRTIQRIYDSGNNETSQASDSIPSVVGWRAYEKPKASTNNRFDWPVIDHGMELALNDQLHTTLSIYSNNGVFEEFEREFKEVHSQPEWYALLHNSGSNALSALYSACDLRPGDEVIFPVYTFHATCSSAMHFGIRPIFVDVDQNGNISAEAVEHAITASTKAVVITHMWGIPCDMAALSAVLKKHPNILLLEDCSHAHGARFNNQVVGTFGDGAAWSLQGQKIITGGEGGIVLTKHRDFHIRGLLWGHYNKRCFVEIPSDHPLRPFASTGSGLKNRAHPLAIRLALDQLRKLPSFQTHKSAYAEKLIAEIGQIPFLEPPQLRATGRRANIQPAWYALCFRFKAERAPKGVTRKTFVQALLDKGLLDVDIPRSTGLLHEEALFTRPHHLLPHLYPDAASATFKHKGPYETAKAFYDELIKIPVWAYQDDLATVEHYCTIFRATAVEFGAVLPDRSGESGKASKRLSAKPAKGGRQSKRPRGIADSQ
ncbi:MAG: hypothetical protein Q9227_006972 [Pyrenula ochraceoflavens]